MVAHLEPPGSLQHRLLELLEGALKFGRRHRPRDQLLERCERELRLRRLVRCSGCLRLAWQSCSSSTCYASHTKFLTGSGTAPFVATYLIAVTGNRLAPAIYITIIAFVALVAALLMPETAGSALDGEIGWSCAPYLRTELSRVAKSQRGYQETDRDEGRDASTNPAREPSTLLAVALLAQWALGGLPCGAYMARRRSKQSSDNAREVRIVMKPTLECNLRNLQVRILQKPARALHAEPLPVAGWAETHVAPEPTLELAPTNAKGLAQLLDRL